MPGISIVKLPLYKCHWSILRISQHLVQVMAWCRQATSHYLSQRWSRTGSPYGVTRPQWLNYGNGVGAKPSQLMMTYCQLYSYKQASMKFGYKYIFFQWNAFVNVICKEALIFFCPQHVNSSPPSATYMHQWTGTSLIPIMACHLFGAKPLPEPILTYCQMNP